MIRAPLVALAAAALLVVSGAAAAMAAIPSHDSFSLDEAGPDDAATAACGFAVTYTVVGQAHLVEYPNGSLRLHFNATRTRYAHGKSVVDNDAFDVLVLSDGSQIVTGTSFNINVKGAGIAMLGAGKLVFDADGNPVFVAGPQQQLTTDRFSVICPLLA
jgi:hypothetical protein